MTRKQATLSYLLATAFLLFAAGCARKASTNVVTEATHVAVPDFRADSAYATILQQCSFGPRVPDTEAHRRCRAYIEAAFRQRGCIVEAQEGVFVRYDGVRMTGANIIARLNTAAEERILIASHWDSRPWADNDPDPARHHDPVMAANDGASGVAVMLELARVLTDSLPAFGIDFVCFDAEDAGVPQWETSIDDREETWCLGAQLWARQPHTGGFRLGILLDMVGGKGAHFFREGFSMRYASNVVDGVWQAAKQAGYSSYFPDSDGGYITDDHLPVNRIAHIPMIDIIPYYPMAESSFGPTWHTVNDTPEHIDLGTLKAVGQTLLYYIYSL